MKHQLLLLLGVFVLGVTLGVSLGRPAPIRAQGSWRIYDVPTADIDGRLPGALVGAADEVRGISCVAAHCYVLVRF